MDAPSVAVAGVVMAARLGSPGMDVIERPATQMTVHWWRLPGGSLYVEVPLVAVAPIGDAPILVGNTL